MRLLEWCGFHGCILNCQKETPVEVDSRLGLQSAYQAAALVENGANRRVGSTLKRRRTSDAALRFDDADLDPTAASTGPECSGLREVERAVQGVNEHGSPGDPLVTGSR